MLVREESGLITEGDHGGLHGQLNSMSLILRARLVGKAQIWSSIHWSSASSVSASPLLSKWLSAIASS